MGDKYKNDIVIEKVDDGTPYMLGVFLARCYMGPTSYRYPVHIGTMFQLHRWKFVSTGRNILLLDVPQY